MAVTLDILEANIYQFDALARILSTAAAIPCSPPHTMCTSGSAWHEKGGFER